MFQYVKNYSKNMVNFQMFFCKFDWTVLSTKECDGKICTRTRSAVHEKKTYRVFLFPLNAFFTVIFFCCNPALLALRINFQFDKS